MKGGLIVRLPLVEVKAALAKSFDLTYLMTMDSLVAHLQQVMAASKARRE